MSLIVQINTAISNKRLGAIVNPNASYWDPLTGTNLNKGNPTSADLSSFSNIQLANIANAVADGTLTLVSGSLPAATDTFSSYSLFASAGVAGGPGWTGITGVAAADALENNF